MSIFYICFEPEKLDEYDTVVKILKHEIGAKEILKTCWTTQRGGLTCAKIIDSLSGLIHEHINERLVVVEQDLTMNTSASINPRLILFTT